MRQYSWRKKLGLGCGATIFAFLLCEMAARMLFPAPPDATREPQLQYQGDAEIGYVHVPNQRAWFDEGLATINSLGLRGPEPAVPKPKGAFRLMVMGDSYTVGWGVNDDETFCAILERLLREAYSDRQFDVINCGVAGYDTLNEERLLKRLAPRLNPDLILVVFHHNDLPHGAASPDADHILDSSQQAAGPRPGQLFHIGVKPTWWNRTIRKSRAIYCIKDCLLRLKNTAGKVDLQAAWEIALLEGKESPAIEEAWRREEKILTRMRSLADSYHCPIGIMASPCREQVRQDYPKALYQKKIKEVGTRLGFFVVDPLPRFLDQRGRVSELFIPYDRYHASAAGHQLIAESLFDFLQASPVLTRSNGSRKNSRLLDGSARRD